MANQFISALLLALPTIGYDVDPKIAAEQAHLEERLGALRSNSEIDDKAQMAQWNDWFNGWSDWRNWRNW